MPPKKGQKVGVQTVSFGPPCSPPPPPPDTRIKKVTSVISTKIIIIVIIILTQLAEVITEESNLREENRRMSIMIAEAEEVGTCYPKYIIQYKYSKGGIISIIIYYIYMYILIKEILF